jgi:molybdenum-dependent DNA-binding transcriptional regulator ModE
MHDDRILNRLKLRDLRILLAVIQAGSVAKAATYRATSQPAVSRAIADMEATLGVELLEPARRASSRHRMAARSSNEALPCSMNSGKGSRTSSSSQTHQPEN